MALYPKAIKKLIPPGDSDPHIEPCGVVYHVAVSTSDSLHDYFDGPSGGIESHFYVRFDGTVEQYRDTNWEADAQVAGNSFIRNGVLRGFISVETEGMGEGQWTPAQMIALRDLGQWAAKVHKFKKQKCTSPFSDGFGYHALFAAWNPNGHSCPGPQRIIQFNHELLKILLAPPVKKPDPAVVARRKAKARLVKLRKKDWWKSFSRWFRNR